MNLYLEGYEVESLVSHLGEYLAESDNPSLDLENIYTRLTNWLLED